MIRGIDALSPVYARLAKRTALQFSNDLPPACYEQLTSECQAVLYTRGQPHRVFERYPSRLAEILDRAVYALAAKSVVGTGEA
jgi:phage terminase large subunit GpA-like protein